MNKLTFEGKGQQHTVDHINRVGRDNRKENLRMATSQSAQNFNTKKRERKIELPEGCGITPDMIPRNIWYIKPNGKHGDGFCIEIKSVKTLNEGHFTWKSTRSTKISLKVKLQETKLKILREFGEEYTASDRIAARVRIIDKEVSNNINE
jgi:hypothetical protein